MNPDQILERLVAAGVLVETAGGESLALGEPFREARGRHLQAVDALDDDDLDEALEEVAGGRIHLPEDRQGQVETIATCRALAECDEESTVDERLKLLPVIDRFSDPTARSEGAPESFTPVAGRQLLTLLRTSRRAIVYVWRDDCDPCDTMREELDAVFPEPPDDVALLAVFGPDYPDAMDELEVVGAPTTLFVHRGDVDVRLHGAQYPEAIESELEVLRGLE